MQRLLENVKRVQSIAPASHNVGAVNGTGVDTIGYDGAAALILVGNIPATSTVDCKLQESADNSNWSDITGAAITQLADTGDNQTPTIDVRLGGRANRKRYIRPVLTIGTANSVLAGVEILLYGAEQVPTVNSPATVLVA